MSNKSGEEYSASKFGGHGEYMRHKRTKLANQDAEIRERASALDIRPIFRGMHIHVNGYTRPGSHELHDMVVRHGGVWKQYLDNKSSVTHIICMQLTPQKRKEFRYCRVVLPQWIVDSVNAGAIMPWTDYRVLDQGVGQQRIGHSGSLMAPQPRNKSYKPETVATVPAPAPPLPPPTAPRSRDIVSHDKAPVSHSGDLDDEFADFPISLVTADSSKGEEEESAEEFNRRLLADPHIRANTVVDPHFLDKYFGNSRLHHLSTWKAELRRKMQHLAAEKVLPIRNTCPQTWVLHIDFDSFFASVGLKSRPHLREKSVVVSHGSGNASNSTSEVASCNYVARSFGICNGMPMERAQLLCPDLVVLPYEFDAYEEASGAFYTRILELQPDAVHAVSVDEALVDISSLVAPNDKNSAISIAKRLKTDIWNDLGLNTSVGVASNVLLARIALRKAKPDGIFCIDAEALNTITEILGPLDVQDLPGFGYHQACKLEKELNITLVSDVLRAAKADLQRVLGSKVGEKLYHYARGIDNTLVADCALESTRKSVSAEVNWGVRFENQEQVVEFLDRLSGLVETRLIEAGFKSRCLTLKLMKRAAGVKLQTWKHLGHGKVDITSKSVQLSHATHATADISRYSVALMRQSGISPGELRGISIQMTKLEPIAAKSSIAPSGRSGSITSMFKVMRAPSRPPVEKVSVMENEVMEDRCSMMENRPPIENLSVVEVESRTPEKLELQVLQEQNMKNHDEDEFRSSTQYVIPSEIDSQELLALPSDIRAKIVQRWNDIQQLNKRMEAEAKSKRTDEPRSKIIPKRTKPEQVSLTQVDFVKRVKVEPDARSVPISGLLSKSQEDVDLSTLAELPADIQNEIIMELNRDRAMKRKRQEDKRIAESMNNFDRSERAYRTVRIDNSVGIRRRRAARFQGVEGFEEIQAIISSWCQSCRILADESPYEAEVEVIATYLSDLIREERAFWKAERLLRTISLAFGSPIGGYGHPVVLRFAETVNTALSELGHGPLAMFT